MNIINKNPKKGIEIIYNPKQFSELGADKIGKYIRENTNTAICGYDIDVDRHIVKFKSNETLKNYRNNNPFTTL